MRPLRTLALVTLTLPAFLVACTEDTESVATTTAAPSGEAGTAAPSTTAPPTSAPSTSSTSSTIPATTAPGADGSLLGVPIVDPATCAFGEPSESSAPEITFVTRGFLLAATVDGPPVRCIAPFENQQRIVWGPQADRLLTGTTRVTADQSFSGVVGDGATFTRPTGRNLVWVDRDRLWKSALDGGDVRDISFLERHLAVAYHPAGVEIATVGIDSDGRHGVWIARNDGTNAQRVVRAEAATITEVAFSESTGFYLSFIASHPDGTMHLHELTLIDEAGLAVQNEFEASIALETSRSLTRLVADPWSDQIAVTEGSCADPEGPRARISWLADDVLPGAAATEAVGWISGSRLVVAAYRDGCDGPRDLWITGPGNGDGEDTDPVLLVRDVGPAVAVRAIHPTPPPPLGEIDLEEFA